VPQIAADGEQPGDIESISAAEMCDVAEVGVEDVILLARHEADDPIVGRIRPRHDRHTLGEAQPLVLTPSQRRGGDVFRVLEYLMREGLDRVLERVGVRGARHGDNEDVQKFSHRLWAAVAAAFVLIVWALWPSPYSRVTNLASRGTNIIAFGDSLTAGYGAQPGEDYPSRLSRLIDKPVINAGVSGDTTDMALARIDADVLSRDPRIVIVGLGGNDFLRGVDIATTERDLRTIIRKIHGAGAMVILLGFRFPSLSLDYEKMYTSVAKDEGCLLIPRMLRGIITDPNLKSDEVHPNGRGYEIMAERVAGPCRKLIRKADAAR